MGVGLDPAALAAPYTPEARQEAARQKELTLLYIGVLEERRNIPLLFETLAKVRQSRPETRLILVGRGEKEYVESCFARARELGVWDAVEYHEKVPQSQVYQLYNRANFFLLPTRYEIFGMVLLEACLLYTSPCVRKSCIKGSKAKSLLGAAEARLYRWMGSYNKIGLYITPSEFYRQMLEKAAFTKRPIRHLTNFLPLGTEYRALPAQNDDLLDVYKRQFPSSTAARALIS